MTVREAKRRMTYSEAMHWVEFFERRGLPSDSRTEMQRGFALLAALTVNVHGGFKGGKQAKVEDFMPKQNDEGDASIETVATMLIATTARRGNEGKSKRKWRRARG